MQLFPKPAKPLVYKLGKPEGRYAKGLAKLVLLKPWNGKNTAYLLVPGSSALEHLSDPGVRDAIRGILSAGHAVVVEGVGQSEINRLSALKNRSSILTLPQDRRLDFFALHRGRTLSIQTEGAADGDRMPVKDQQNALKQNLISLLEGHGTSSVQAQITKGTPLAQSGRLHHLSRFGLLAQPFLSPGATVAQSSTLDLLELALPTDGSLYQYTQQWNLHVQFGGNNSSGAPQSCPNFYEVSYLVYPIHLQWTYNFQSSSTGNGCCPGNLSNPESPLSWSLSL